MLSKKMFLVVVLSSLSILSFNSIASPVNVNAATVEQIADSLKGIGPAKAEAISEHCKKVTCSKPEDLLEVKGIGEKTLAKITMDLRFEDEMKK